jgi:hypothetical protein
MFSVNTTQKNAKEVLYGGFPYKYPFWSGYVQLLVLFLPHPFSGINRGIIFRVEKSIAVCERQRNILLARARIYIALFEKLHSALRRL